MTGKNLCWGRKWGNFSTAMENGAGMGARTRTENMVPSPTRSVAIPNSGQLFFFWRGKGWGYGGIQGHNKEVYEAQNLSHFLLLDHNTYQIEV